MTLQTAQAEADCLRQVLLAEMVARVVRRRMAADYHRTLTRGNKEYERWHESQLMELWVGV